MPSRSARRAQPIAARVAMMATLALALAACAGAGPTVLASVELLDPGKP
jgi:hypothetical protein